MRRSSSGSSVQEARPVQSQVGPSDAVWWDSRLVQYRHLVVFIWNSLTFKPSVLPGTMIWAVTNILIMLLLNLGGSALEVMGNLLLMVAILYALLHVGLRYGNLTVFPTWNRDCDTRFQQICQLIAKYVCLVTAGVSTVGNSRTTSPRMFYGVGFLAAFMLYHLGEWFSTVVVLHLIVSVLLLLPLLMEHSNKTQSNPDHMRHTLQQLWMSLVEQAKVTISKLSRAIRDIRPRTARPTTNNR